MILMLSSWSLLPQSPNIIAPRQRGLTRTPVLPSVRISMVWTLRHQAKALSALHRLGAVAHAQLAVHRAGVLLDRVLGEVQRLGELRVGGPAGHQLQHRTLPLREPQRLVTVVALEHRPAEADQTYRAGDPPRRPILVGEPRGAGGARRLRGDLPSAGEQEHARARFSGAQLLTDLRA